MKRIKSVFKNIDVNIILITILILIIFSKLFLDGMVYGHDSFVHLFRIANFSDNIIHGDIFSKIGFNYINGFGYGTGIFYPQLNLLPSALIYILSKDINLSLDIYVFFNALLSGIVMYLFLKYKLQNKDSAIIGSILYIFAPYFLTQSMVRGATGESVIFLSLPLIFYGIERILNRDKYGNLLVILGSIYILQSHLISTIFVSIFVILYLFLDYKKVFQKNILIDLAKCVFVTVLLSLYFIIPFIEHYTIGNYNMLISTMNTTSQNVLPLCCLIFSKKAYSLGYILPTTIIILPLIYNKFNKEKQELFKPLILSIITIIMITVPYIWGHTKFLDIIQFPWRLLSFAIFFIAIIGAYIIKLIQFNKQIFLLLLFTIIFMSLFQINSYEDMINIREPGFDLENDVKNQLVDNEHINLHTSLGSNDYLPKECSIDYIASRGNELIAKKGNLLVSDYTFKNGKISANAKVENNANIELPLIYYLGYNITIDNQRIEYYKNKNGFIEINLNNIDGKLKVSYTGTRLDIIANTISITSGISFFIYYILKYIKNKLERK